MNGTAHGDRTDSRHRRLLGSAVVATVAAAILLALSVAAAAQTEPPANPTLALQQLVDGELRCVSPDASCTAVDLYGQEGNRSTSPIRPGDQRTTTVELTNAGDIAATRLELAPGPCENEGLEGETPMAELCTAVTVSVACTTGGTTVSLGPQTLTSFGQNGPHTVGTDLAAGASTTCRFAVTYPDDAVPITEAIRAVQPVTWTLIAPEPPQPELSPPSGSASAVPTPPRGRLAFTGSDAPLLALAGLALVVVGGLLHRLSRRAGDAEPSLPAP